MKRFFILSFLFTMFFLSFTNLKAQTSFSCTYRQYCYWDEVDKKYENCKGYEERMKSTYYVNSKQYDKDYDVYTYYVTSDVGNKYYFIFDPKNKQVRAIYYKDNQPIEIVWSVKAIF